MLVGRQFEQNLLNEITRSDKSEFVAIYGRRRVGKTYLVRETFNYNFAFQHTGVQNGDKTRQLIEFERSLKTAGMDKCPKLKDWFMAFDLLGELLQGIESEKKIVFIDEMPWLDTPKSDFLSALEHFWNGWVTMRRDTTNNSIQTMSPLHCQICSVLPHTHTTHTHTLTISNRHLLRSTTRTLTLPSL